MKTFDELDMFDNRKWISFYERDDVSDKWYKIWQADIELWHIQILKNKRHEFYSVYIKKAIKEDNKETGYIELSSHKATNLWQAKQIAEKMYDIVLWYKVPWPWKE